MKILHIITSIATGGAEKSLLTLCRELKSRGCDLRVIYLKKNGKASNSLCGAFNLSGVTSRRAKARSLILACLRSDLGYDLIHTHLPKADFLGLILSKLIFRGTPWVCTVHDRFNPDHEWRGMRFLRLMFWVWKRADAVIAITQHVKDWLVENGVPEEKARVIYYGVESIGFVARDSEDVRAKC